MLVVLTREQVTLLRQLAAGQCEKQIAIARHEPWGAVHSRTHALRRKTRTNSNTQLILWAYKAGLVE